MKDIKIKPANNGWIVEIGCQTFVAENKDKMLSEIGRYIDKPEEVKKEYMESAKNKPENGGPIAWSNGGILTVSGITS
jgi:hypothetical protein